jgi:hypothetical protein
MYLFKFVFDFIKPKIILHLYKNHALASCWADFRPWRIYDPPKCRHIVKDGNIHNYLCENLKLHPNQVWRSEAVARITSGHKLSHKIVIYVGH